jgi:hypothetical protein
MPLLLPYATSMMCLVVAPAVATGELQELVAHLHCLRCIVMVI